MPATAGDPCDEARCDDRRRRDHRTLDPGDRYRATLLAVVMLAVTAFGSLMTIVTVALGTIADDLETSRATLTCHG
ncbi:MAG: hypothetical protein R2710_04210 [Acidimicrobiales bacterium]